MLKKQIGSVPHTWLNLGRVFDIVGLIECVGMTTCWKSRFYFAWIDVLRSLLSVWIIM